jgi:integrase/recombinase XerC
MTRDKMAPRFKDGDRACPICAKLLPAHQTWPGARYRFCGAPECAAEIKKIPHGKFIEVNERRCEAGGCDNFVPEGLYASRPTYLSCSEECWYRRDSRGSLALECACGCGIPVLRRGKRTSITGLVFLSRQHQGNYASDKYVRENCGIFLQIFKEYIDGSASLRYRRVSYVRATLCPFFKFLNEQGIMSLEAISPKTITAFLVWAKTSGHLNAVHDISPVSMFFKWAIAEGNRIAANPVIGLIHAARRKHHSPRPVEDSELEMMWRLLAERGSPRLRLGAAIAEEAGLRIGEICRLRVSDIDAVRQTVFVRLPNKTNRERSVNFSGQTKRYFVEWMAARDQGCGHDYLFHNTLGDPLLVHALAGEFKRALCKVFNGKTVNKTGFDKWSTHRLRHTMASRLVQGGAELHTIMAQGGWVSAESVTGYAKVDRDVARRGYDEAMRLSAQQRTIEPVRQTLTPAQFLSRRAASSVPLKLSMFQEIEA